MIILRPGGYFKIIEHDINIYKFKKEYENNDIFVKDYLNNNLEKLYKHNKISDIIENNNFYGDVPIIIFKILESKKELKKINYRIRKTDIGWGSKLDENHFKEGCESVKESVINDLYIDNIDNKNTKYEEEIEKIIEDSKRCKGVWTWHEFLYVKL